MIKNECEIICDLLPLYVDDVCSDKTREAVKEHLAVCESCREKYENMKNTQLVAEKANRKQKEFFRRLKQRQSIKNAAGILVVAVIFVLLWHLKEVSGANLSYAMIPLLSIAALILIESDNGWDKSWQKLAGSVIAVLCIYEIGINEYIAHRICSGKAVFGLANVQIGPFVRYQIYAILGIGVVVLLVNCIWKKNNRFVSCLCIGAVGLSYAYDSLYSRLDTLEVYLESLHRVECVLVPELLAVLGIILLIEKRKKNRMENFE